MKAISSLILFIQSGMSYLFSGAEVALNACDASQLNKNAIEFLNGGKRSLATCALANHVANAGLSLINGSVVGSFCGVWWGIGTGIFSLFGLWYLGELSPKLIAQEKPNAFLNQHASRLLKTKQILSPLINRIVKEEPITKEELDERELVSAAKQADEENSVTYLPMYKNAKRETSIPQISSRKSVEHLMSLITAHPDDIVLEWVIIDSWTLKKIGYVNSVTVTRWFMNHKKQEKNLKATLSGESRNI